MTSNRQSLILPSSMKLTPRADGKNKDLEPDIIHAEREALECSVINRDVSIKYFLLKLKEPYR